METSNALRMPFQAVQHSNKTPLANIKSDKSKQVSDRIAEHADLKQSIDLKTSADIKEDKIE
jgi:hypothetical protein